MNSNILKSSLIPHFDLLTFHLYSDFFKEESPDEDSGTTPIGDTASSQGEIKSISSVILLIL